MFDIVSETSSTNSWKKPGSRVCSAPFHAALRPGHQAEKSRFLFGQTLRFVSPTRPSPPSLRFVSPKRLPTRWASKAGTRNGRTVRRRRGVAFQGPSRNLVCSHPILFWFVQKSTACSEDCGGKRKIAERPPISGLPEIGMSCGGESGARSKSYRPGGAQAAPGFSFKRLRTQNPNTPTSVSARPNQVIAYCR